MRINIINTDWLIDSSLNCTYANFTFDYGTGRIRWYNRGEIAFRNTTLVMQSYGGSDGLMNGTTVHIYDGSFWRRTG